MTPHCSRDIDSLCRAALQAPEIREVQRVLAAAGAGENAAEIIARACGRVGAGFWEPMTGPCREAGLSEESLVRYLLLRCVVERVRHVDGLPVHGDVRHLILDEFRFIADPAVHERPLLHPDHPYFHMVCRVVTFRRFPSGQSCWEVGGFPVSWLGEMPPRCVPSVLLALMRMGGRKPLFILHYNHRREMQNLILEDEDWISFYRIASSMEMQPAIRGYLATAWMLDPDVGVVAPHLKWVGRGVEPWGGVRFVLGPARPENGIYAGSARRRKLYESGKWKPRIGGLLWPRPGLLRCAEAMASNPAIQQSLITKAK